MTHQVSSRFPFRIVLATLFLFSSASRAVADTRLIGAGATFPFPIYSKWFDEFHKKHPDIRINYQSIGSGGGIRQFTAKTVDFGASDDPMSDEEISKVDGKMLHIPTVLGGVVPAFNVSGIDKLNFSGPVLADIFMGKIKYWNDSAIVELNPGVKLPRDPITVVRRSDGSGTTFCFTDYLAKVSEEWKRKVGSGISVNWPIGIGGKGNEGVAGTILQVPNSLGYVELAYAKQSNIPYGAVKNRSGRFVTADVDTITAAGSAVKMPNDFRVSITDAPGENSYPIATYTWLLIKEENDSVKGPVLKNFLAWMLADGQAYAPNLDYAPLPDDVNTMVKEAVKTIR